jgi:hypothetical protein
VKEAIRAVTLADAQSLAARCLGLGSGVEIAAAVREALPGLVQART